MSQHQKEQMKFLLIEKEQHTPYKSLIESAVGKYKDRKISSQLYMQYTSLTELVWSVFQTSVIYYRQWEPNT